MRKLIYFTAFVFFDSVLELGFVVLAFCGFFVFRDRPFLA